MIDFNRPPFLGTELEYVRESAHSHKMSGDGPFTKRCQQWFENHLGCVKALLVPSCTHALEMAALLIGIEPGDEVIMPSYTFVSTANAFVLRGAKIVFVDIRPDTLNIDERKIEAAITPKTKAIVPVHYAGVGCAMDEIMALAEQYGLYVIEDAAQGMMSSYKGRALGTIGHIGCFSFHDTKNYTSGGEGGLLIVNDKQFAPRSEIIREKGTNRSQFFRGMVDKYSWVDFGSSYLLSDLQAAFLLAQLEQADTINSERLGYWQRYYEGFAPLAAKQLFELPHVPDGCVHNAHMFYLKVRNLDQRSELIAYLSEQGVQSVFHYIPLHTAQAGRTYGRFVGEDTYTTPESERLLRLPMFYGLTTDEQQQVIDAVMGFFS